MNLCSAVSSMTVLLGSIVIIYAQPPTYQRPLNQQPVYYGTPDPFQPDYLSMFIPESQRREPSALRRMLLQIDDIMAAAGFASPNPLASLSGASEIYSSYSGERELPPLKGLASALDVIDLFDPNPFVVFFAITSMYLSFTGD